MVKQLLPMYQVFVLNTVDVLLYTQKLLENSNKKQQTERIFKK